MTRLSTSDDFEMIALEADSGLEQFLFCLKRGFRWYVESAREGIQMASDGIAYDLDFELNDALGIRQLEKTVVQQCSTFWKPLSKSIQSSSVPLHPWPFEILKSEFVWLRTRWREMENRWNTRSIPLDEEYIQSWRTGILSCKWFVDVHVNTNGSHFLSSSEMDLWETVTCMTGISTDNGNQSEDIRSLVQTAAIQIANMMNSRLQWTLPSIVDESGMRRLETAYKFGITILWAPFLVWVWENVVDKDGLSDRFITCPFPFCSMSHMKQYHAKFDQIKRAMDPKADMEGIERSRCIDDTKSWHILADTFEAIILSLCTKYTP